MPTGQLAHRSWQQPGQGPVALKMHCTIRYFDDGGKVNGPRFYPKGQKPNGSWSQAANTKYNSNLRNRISRRLKANAKLMLPKQAIQRPPTPKRTEREEMEEGEISAEGASKRVAIGSQGAASSSAVELATAAATGGLGGPPPPPELTDADLLNGVPGVGSAVAPMAVDGMD